MQDDGKIRQRSARALGSGAGASGVQWPTAEDENVNLYEQENGAKLQGVAASPVCHDSISLENVFVTPTYHTSHPLH